METPSLTAVASTQYGAPSGEYRTGGRASRVILGILCAFLLISGILGILGIVDIFSGILSPTSGGLSFRNITLIAVGLCGFRPVFRGLGSHAQLFEQGFIISRGGKTITGRWSDIVSVTQKITTVRHYGIPVHTLYVYTIALANGEKVRVDNNSFGKIAEMGNTIQRMSTNALLPRAIASYKSGTPLTFGTIIISQSGISNGRETVPWSNIRQFTVQKGAVIIRRNDKQLAWVKTSVSQTPNVYVLTALVDRIQGGVL